VIATPAHRVWLCGDLLGTINFGDITTARGAEMYLPLWLRLWGALGTGTFNISVAR
jgi:hypothetical protein